MKRNIAVSAISLALVVSLVPLSAAADGKKGHKDDSHDRSVVYVQANQGCPPGLAKKNNGCRPPGQAKKETYIWQRGERIDRDYVVIRDPRRYNLDPRYTYWESGDRIYRVDRETGKVLNLIGAIADLMN